MIQTVLEISSLALKDFSRAIAGRSQEALAECVIGLYIIQYVERAHQNIHAAIPRKRVV